MIARAWHALSDEAFDGIPFDGNRCTCRNFAPIVGQVMDVFYGEPVREPEGLGAVVVNPLTDGVWVRAAHPALAWSDPATASAQQWSDPTSEDWFTWDDLPRPLVMQSPGWTPATTPGPGRDVPEPTGIGAVVVDTADETWVRVYNGRYPWFKVDAGGGQVAQWEDLGQPVRIRGHGWNQPGRE